TRLESGKQLRSDVVLFAAGRTGCTDRLNLELAGLEAGKRGLLEVDQHFRTRVPHIYAAGDVIGFPSLASTSMEQGRLAACHAFGIEANTFPEHFPFGIYAVPEISMVGKTEQELADEGIPYEVGVARLRETARGQILGLERGILKMIFSLETRKVLGVHILGEQATELIHIGQAAMALGGTLDYFVENVFNYPTLAEAYKVAALDAWNRMRPLSPAVLDALVETERSFTEAPELNRSVVPDALEDLVEDDEIVEETEDTDALVQDLFRADSGPADPPPST
ncbi:MAG: FAD-dependent oxidoreductase, partial [Gemmatimonadetes bacterium]|nr:FAD-dependent oxidoreductase [Gemmatimonadota bacterium]